MPDLNAIVEVLFTLFIVFLLGYVFLLVFWQLSPLLAVLFCVVMAVVVIGILSGIFRR
jgi:Na+/H+ antiporter NhaC